MVPQSTGHLNGARPCGVMKMAKSCKEGMAANRRRSGLEGHRFKTRCQQGLFTVESALKCTLPLVIFIHNIKSCVRCIGCERCDMSSLNKRWWRQPLKKLYQHHHHLHCCNDDVMTDVLRLRSQNSSFLIWSRSPLAFDRHSSQFLATLGPILQSK